MSSRGDSKAERIDILKGHFVSIFRKQRVNGNREKLYSFKDYPRDSFPLMRLHLLEILPSSQAAQVRGHLFKCDPMGDILHANYNMASPQVPQTLAGFLPPCPHYGRSLLI